MSIVIIFFQVKILLFKQLWLYNRLIGAVAESKEMIATPQKKGSTKNDYERSKNPFFGEDSLIGYYLWRSRPS